MLSTFIFRCSTEAVPVNTVEIELGSAANLYPASITDFTLSLTSQPSGLLVGRESLSISPEDFHLEINCS